MKNIIICIDGTSSATEGAPSLPAAPSLSSLPRRLVSSVKRLVGAPTVSVRETRRLPPTNVLLFVRALSMRDASNHPQIVHYIRGVGTDESARLGGRVRAAMYGTGLSQMVQDAYVFLVNNCERGDRVYILGFSRGAAAARSLSGLTELFGVLPKDQMEHFPDAWDYFNSHPDARDKDALRKKSLLLLAGIAAKGEKLRLDHEAECTSGTRQRVGLLSELPHAPSFAGQGEDGALRDGVTPEEYVPLPLHFVGVWDTVFSAQGEGFHEQRLAWNVATAYQALAVHEVRALFEPILWTTSCSHQEVIQTWFPGAHSDVGGGNRNEELSFISLEWMIRRATESYKVHRGPQLRFEPLPQGWWRRNPFAPVTYPQDDQPWPIVARKHPPSIRQIGTTERLRRLGTHVRVPLEFRHEAIDARASHSTTYRSRWAAMLDEADRQSLENVFPEEIGDRIAFLMRVRNSGVDDHNVELVLATELSDIDAQMQAIAVGADEDVTFDDIKDKYKHLYSPS